MQNGLQKEISFDFDQNSKILDANSIETSAKKMKPLRTSQMLNNDIVIDNQDRELKIDDVRLQNFFNKYLKNEDNKEKLKNPRASILAQDVQNPINLQFNRRSRRSEIKIFEQQKEEKMKKRKKQKAEERQKQKKDLEQKLEDEVNDIIQEVKKDSQKILKNIEKILDDDYPEEIFESFDLKQNLQKTYNKKDQYENFKRLIQDVIEQEEKIYKKHKLMKIPGFKKLFNYLTDYMKSTLNTTKDLCKINQTLLLVQPNKKNIFEMQRGIVLDDIHETLLKIKHQQKQLTNDSKINPKYVQKRFIRQLDMIQENRINTDVSQMKKRIADQNKTEVESNTQIFKKVCLRYEKLYNELDTISQKLQESQQQNIYNQKLLRKKTYRNFKKVFEMSSKNVCQNLLDILD